MTRKDKVIMRLAIAISLLFYMSILLFFSTNYAESIEARPEKFILLRIALGIWGALGSLSMIYIWLKMIQHWINRDFSNKCIQSGWMALLLGLNILGGIIYYLVVIEFDRGDVQGGNIK